MRVAQADLINDDQCMVCTVDYINVLSYITMILLLKCHLYDIYNIVLPCVTSFQRCFVTDRGWVLITGPHPHPLRLRCNARELNHQRGPTSNRKSKVGTVGMKLKKLTSDCTAYTWRGFRCFPQFFPMTNNTETKAS